MIENTIKEICLSAKEAAKALALASSEIKNEVLLKAADNLIADTDKILKANAEDIKNLSPEKAHAFKDRLLLNEERIKAMAQGVRKVASLPDPVGRVLASWRVPSGLEISRVTIPLGVLCVIFEARPNVCADAAALCFKAGSSVILRGGGDSFNSCLAIYDCFKKALEECSLPQGCINLVPSKDHEAVDILLKQEDYIDVLIPRGGKKLIEKISQSRIPSFKHLNGICHTYIHKDADMEMACKVLVNAKLRRTSICGATETVLLDKELGEAKIKQVLGALIERGCEVRADEYIRSFMPDLPAAKEEDWGTEYLDAIISAKTVSCVKEAVEHIGKYGSNHTESIITQDAQAAEEFLNGVNSAVVMHNTSTQFCDGGEFGMGAEIGIATGKLHARGPVGLEQRVTFKYKVEGHGETRK